MLPPNLRIRIVRHDITTMTVDGIVNAANRELAGGGGVDGAIQRAAGPQLLEFCAGLGGCPTGEAKITPGFRLPAPWVIHTVGPVWQGGSRDEDRLLACCYQKSLTLAAAHDLKTLAFPAISTGVYGFPSERAAAIALRVVIDFLETNPLPERVYLVCFSSADEALYQHRLAELSAVRASLSPT